MFRNPHFLINRSSWRLFSTTRTRWAQEKVQTGIVLLNMGGPQTTDQVHDYLLRIMTDRDMIQLPVQSKLGPWIAQRRAPEVAKKYSEIGGGSPILKWTNLQGKLLAESLDKISPESAPHKHYVAFRYVNPLTEHAIKSLEEDAPKRIILFSQYPQYSCATSGSSFNAFYDYFRKNKSTLLEKSSWSIIDRWPSHPLLAKTFAQRIRDELIKFDQDKRDNVIILFSAHSLPQKAVSRGDSYPSEVGASVHAVMDELKFSNPYSLVWQSKVGPLPWLEPFTDAAIKSYVSKGHKDFILVPIAFVNEHIETLHELDIEYCQELAEELKIKRIGRAQAPNDHPLFIEALTDIVHTHLKGKNKINPKFLTRCAHCVNPRCQSSKDFFKNLCD